MGKVCKKSWIVAIFLGVMLFAAGFAFQSTTVDAQAATTPLLPECGAYVSSRIFYGGGTDQYCRNDTKKCRSFPDRNGIKE